MRDRAADNFYSIFMFYDREEAGILLAQKLRKFGLTDAVVLAVPRGGVPVGYAVACELGLPLQLVLTKKIGHPMNPEYAIGAADVNGYFISPEVEVPDEYVHREVLKVQERLREMQRSFSGLQPELPLKNKTVIIVDDGIATGRTLQASVQLIRKTQPAKIVIAVPVAPAEAVRTLSAVADDIITVLVPREFSGVGQFYEKFTQVSDEEVMELLEKAQHLRQAG